MKKWSNCIICGKSLTGRQAMFCSEVCKNKAHQSYDAQKKRGIERKLYFVQLLGGRCDLCGYAENLSCLSFHHNSGKEFSLDARSFSNRKAEYLLDEIFKCRLLCHNCHTKLHNPEFDLAKLSFEPTALTTELRALVEKYVKTNNIKVPNSVIIAEKPFSNNDKGSIRTDKQFLHNLEQIGLEKGQKIVLGVSGGIDSIVMLDLFCAKKDKYELVVAHLNHGVRTKSDRDEKFVRKMAEKYGLEFVSKKLGKEMDPWFAARDDTEKVAKKSKNLEEYLRNERRQFLLDVKTKHKADFVALAHNQNDQAETFILKLLRGAGPAGLSAMKMKENEIVRPLLDISREEIENYAKEKDLKWHEDITNQDATYSRNYIRHQILPLFERLNPQYLETICSQAKLQGEIDGYVKKEAEKILFSSVIPGRKPGAQPATKKTPKQEDPWRHTRDDTKPALENEKITSLKSGMTKDSDVNMLQTLDDLVLFEVFVQLYEKAKGDRNEFDKKSFYRLKELIKNTNGKKEIPLTAGLKAVRSYKSLEILPQKEDNKYSPNIDIAIKIGKNRFGHWILEAEKQNNINSVLLPDKTEINIKNIQNLTVRSFKPGDKIAKTGINGMKKLQDLFVDAKIDRDLRRSWPVVVQNDEIIWIPRLAISRNIASGNIKLKIRQKDEE